MVSGDVWVHEISGACCDVGKLGGVVEVWSGSGLKLTLRLSPPG